jgi:nucleoside-diphosphate-sugar epimerase
VLCDVFDRDRLRRHFVALRPEAVIGELTSLPQTPNPLRMKAVYRENNRVRVEGTANLIEAAQEVGVRRIVCQSMASWYAPDGPAPRTETDPLYLQAPEPIGSGVRALKQMEDEVLGARLEGILLRYGGFYGPGTWLGEGGVLWKLVKKRRYPVLGEGAGVYSLIQIEDAAAATVVALERGAPGGIYNVVDDEPAPIGTWLPAYAAAIGAPPPPHVPAWLADRLTRTGFLAWERTMPPASNKRIVRELDWRPRWASWREGFRVALGAVPGRAPRRASATHGREPVSVH